MPRGWGSDRPAVRDNFGDEYGMSHYNKRDTCGIGSCAGTREAIELPSGVVSGSGRRCVC